MIDNYNDRNLSTAGDDCQEVGLRAAYIEEKKAQFLRERNSVYAVPTVEMVKSWVREAIAFAQEVMENGGQGE